MLKKIFTWLLIIGLAFPLSNTVPVYAVENEPIEIDLATLSEGNFGSGYNYSSGLLTITDEGFFKIITSTSVSGRGIVIDTAGATAAITLDDVSISNTGSNACALALADGAKAVVTLSGINTLASGQDRAGLEVPEGAEITITGTSADKLTVTGGRWSAGLGGSYGQNGGAITITGVELTATGHDYGAGIGSGRKSGTSGSSGGTISIADAKVTATAGASGAGIGGGYMAAGGTITITDSIIYATAGNYGAGIGGGPSGSSGIISISDSYVEATGGAGGGAGIGGGDEGHAYSISITGASTVINAQGGSYAAGIGGGDGRNGSSLDGRITISGGNVTATGGTWGAGIGGGRAGNGGIIFITGGEVTCTGGTEGGAGIGGGRYNGTGGAGGSVVITKAAVTATGTGGAKDVGAGLNSLSNGSLKVGLSNEATFDSFATRALLTLNAGGADQAGTTIGTCTISGTGAGNIAGTYIGGVKVMLIDLATVSGSGDGYSFSSGLLTISGEGPFIITSTAPTSNRVLVSTPESVTANITIHDLTITNTTSGNCAFALSGSSQADLTLSGSSSFISGTNRAGLEVPLGTILTIFGSTADSLNVTGGKYAAGIGGGYSVTPAVSGTITIKGGTINARGDATVDGTGAGAGIGGGRGGSGGTITIDGGDITATGGYRAAGIGGGQGGTSGTIIIKNGKITALGTTYSAGIGGGTFRPADSITIEGGTIDATGVGGGAGIGSGYINQDLSETYSGGTINISGGDITARALSQGSGIGSGIITNITYSIPTTVTITGGVINASSYSGPGIGSREGTITISGGTVTATSNFYGAGIGGGYRESGGTINITGGTTIASGAVTYGGAGIGGGYPHDTDVLNGGTINISGGDITATGGEYSAGIGGGYAGTAGTITITGGDITAAGSNGGAGIGGGLAGGTGTITITGGNITATGTESGAGIGKGHGGGNGAIVISQAQVTAASQYGNDVISAGNSGTVHIGFTGDPDPDSWVCDPFATRADVTLTNGGLNEDGLVLGTCLISGAGAGDLAGSYTEGVKQIVTYGIATIGDQIFTVLTEGYNTSDRQTLSITIESTGTGALNNLAVALSGDHAGNFILSQPALTTLANQGDTTTFTIVPQTMLGAGTYMATVTVSADNMNDVTFTITQTVKAAFGGGNGSSAEEAYEISTPVQLVQLAYDVEASLLYEGKYFKLMNNLDLSGIPEWTPIGTTANQFKGTFDGNGHTVSNVTIGGPTLYNNELTDVGLFGCIGSNASVSNVFVANISVYSNVSGKTGGLVGFNDGGIINHCGTSGSIYGAGTVGGLVGQNKGDITNSFASVDITSSGSSSGGLVGSNDGGNFINCFATGNIDAGAYPTAGGLVGYTVNWSGTSYIQNCYATGNVSGSAWGYIGGLFGRNYEGRTTLTDNYWNADALITASELSGWTPEVHGSADGYLAKSSAEMKSSDFTTLLNNGRPDPFLHYGFELVSGINEDYPVFRQELDGDTTPPTVTDKTISAANITQSSVELSWQRATDDISNQSALSYRVYQSNTNNIGTVSEIEENGTPVGDFMADTAVKTVTGLSSSTYFFNVIVVDEAGNKTAYDAKEITTTAAITSPVDSGAYTPTIIVTTEETTNSITNTTQINSINTLGTASANVSSAIVNALLGKAISNGGTTKKDIIEVVVHTQGNIGKLEVTVPQKDLEKITSETDSSFAIASPFISITFDNKALDTISRADSSGSVVVSAGLVDSSALSAADRAKVQGRLVYDFTVMNGDMQVSDFNGGHATVSIPYTLKSGENPNSVVVYYLKENNRLKIVRGHYDTETKVVVFRTTHFSKFIIGYNPLSFSDVATDAWYKNAVEFIASRGITSGTGDNQFSPDAKLTRGQFIVLLMNAYQISASTDHAENFKDAGNTYYTDYLAAAKRLGIANGVGNNMFAPEQEITRQEMFVLVFNALQVIDELPTAITEKELTSFNDAGQAASWAIEALSALVKADIIGGGSNNNLNPTSTTTRAEMAQVLYNLLSK